LLARENGGAQALGRILLAAAPKLMKLLAVVGTAAMFLVGGGILTHGLPAVHHAFEHWSAAAGMAAPVAGLALDLVFGVVCGAVALLAAKAFSAARRLAGAKSVA
jgi:hypothetical protein